MHVLVIELPGEGTQVKGPGTLDEMRAAAREHAGRDLIESGWPNDAAVEVLCVEGGDIAYAIHELPGVNPRIQVTKPQESPTILINDGDVERMTGGGYGPTVADVDVLFGDKYSRFFITIGINGRGQAVCEVATNRRDLHVTRKEVTAMRKDPIEDHPTIG